MLGGEGDRAERGFSVVALSSVDTNKWAPLLARDWEPSPTAQPAPDYERRGPLRQRQNRLTPEQVTATAERYLEGANDELAAEFGAPGRLWRFG